MQPISLTREFRPYPEIEDIDDLVRQLHHQATDLTWEQLNSPVMVILGSPGVGKTTEFKLRAEALSNQAFTLFVPLCQIDANGWNLDPLEEARLEHWESSSNSKGIFFLDSIDEARLSDPRDLRKALVNLHGRLKHNLPRVQIFLSSRFYDWALQDVRSTVHALLTVPVFLAQQSISPASDSATDDGLPPMPVQEVEPVVLMPLSQTERQKLALHYEVCSELEFWEAVRGGDYLEMAVRPLDLEGLVAYWNKNQKLSNYAELMHAHVERRLREQNAAYLDRGAALAAELLHTGAQEIAMAMEVSSVKEIGSVDIVNSDGLSVVQVLPAWEPQEIRRLLGTAVFGLSSFKRFSFTHRSTREYLFGLWAVNRRAGGVPLERLMQLFTKKQYGKSVLIPARRYGLSWACSLDHEFRKWVAIYHPEIFVFDGDPSRWDALTAESAFKTYLTKLSQGWQSDWFNSPAEKRRVCAAMRPNFLPSMLAQFSSDEAACSTALTYAYEGRVMECAAEIQNILDQSASTTHRYRQAVAALGRVGTAAQLNGLKAKLLSGEFFQNNQLIAEILEAFGVMTFSLAELKYVFSQAGPEERFGGGAMARTLKHMLAEESELKVAERVLEALLECLPAQSEDTQDLSLQSPAWIYGVLGDVFERTLELLPSDAGELTVCVAAAHRTWSFRHSDYSGVDDVKKLRDLVSRKHTLRWYLLDEIARNDEANRRSSLFHDFSIVGLEKHDSDAVILRANDTNLGEEVNNAWFKVGVRLVLDYFDEQRKSAALQQFIVPPYEEPRSKYIEQAQAHEEQRATQRAYEHQTYLKEEQQERLDEKKKIEGEIELILRDVSAIANAEFNLLLKATRYIQYHLRGSYFEKIDLDEVTSKFGQRISDALAMGLVTHFRNCSVENPAAHPDGSVPWTVLLAAAGAQILVDQGSALRRCDIEKIALLDVWYPNGPSSTFEAVFRGNEVEIASALEEWLLAEAATATSGKKPHSTIRFLFSAPPTVQRLMLSQLKDAKVPQDVIHPTNRKGIWDAMASHGILSTSEQSEIASRHVTHTSEQTSFDIGWLRRWIYSSPAAAWSWFKSRIAASEDQGAALAQFAENVGNLDANTAFSGEARVKLLVEIYALLRPHAKQLEDASYFERSTIESLIGRIPSMIRQEPGVAANQALAELACLESNEVTKRWLLSEQLHHASRNAELEAVTNFQEVKKLIEGFESEAESADQLLEQVWARLREIKRGVEEGPFSDRNMFKAGMDERDIQLWLAARLFERVPLTRFNVHREEEVDSYKKPDIQLSAGDKLVVCLEIKPLDTDQRYSAAKLVKTLRDQIVGQYLKGDNSSHGVLVLFRLQERSWHIGSSRDRNFDELMVYLNEQATEIVEQHNRRPGVVPVRALRIFDIKCYL